MWTDDFNNSSINNLGAHNRSVFKLSISLCSLWNLLLPKPDCCTLLEIIQPLEGTMTDQNQALQKTN